MALVANAGGLFFATDDVQATYEELSKRGVDIGFRDPSGNQMRGAVDVARSAAAGSSAAGRGTIGACASSLGSRRSSAIAWPPGGRCPRPSLRSSSTSRW
jgi:hypothetical protein